jgi:hypothetical protein
MAVLTVILLATASCGKYPTLDTEVPFESMDFPYSRMSEATLDFRGLDFDLLVPAPGEKTEAQKVSDSNRDNTEWTLTWLTNGVRTTWTGINDEEMIINAPYFPFSAHYTAVVEFATHDEVLSGKDPVRVYLTVKRWD